MKTGDTIFFYPDDSLQSFLITKLSGSKFTHAGIILKTKSEFLVLESTFGTNRKIVNLNSYKNRKYEIVTTSDYFDYSIFNELDFIHYGYLDLVMFGIQYVLSWFNIKFKPKNYSGEICTEFVQLCLNMNCKLLTPEQLYQKLL